LNSPEGLVLVQRASDQNDVVIGSHIRGARLRSSSASFEEVDLLLPGTARRVMHVPMICCMLNASAV
jgi:1-phosphatidylinositol-4-phosphate 5-kinase